MPRPPSRNLDALDHTAHHLCKRLSRDCLCIQLGAVTGRPASHSQDFFHRVVEPSNVVPSRLLLERYQYHHVGFLKYNSSNTRLHHRLPLQGGAGCVRCTDPAHPEGCESWVVRCHPVPESGLGFGGEKLCYRGCEFRTCAGDRKHLPPNIRPFAPGGTLCFGPHAVLLRRQLLIRISCCLQALTVRPTPPRCSVVCDRVSSRDRGERASRCAEARDDPG